MNYPILAVAVVLLVVVGCGIDAFIRRQNKRIPLTNDGSAVDHGGGDGGGGD